MAQQEQKLAFIIGLSGLSSSGKTTLSRYLRSIFPQTFILHEDDFYIPDKDIPTHSGLADWDCVESINYPSMRQTIQHIRSHGTLPPDLNSIEDQNSVGNLVVSDTVLQELQEKVKAAGISEKLGNTRVAIVDGFLLFHEGSIVEELFDLRLLLRAPYEKAKQRREARSGYVTVEGFWTDPPGYFDKIVWPNYVQAHKYCFVDEDITGDLKPEVVEQRRIRTPPEVDLPMEGILRWAVDLLLDELKKIGTTTSIPE